MTQPNQYILRLTADDLPAQSFPLSHFPFTLGRSADLDCVLVGNSVSRKHAVLQEEEDGIYVVDLASRCGTFVNGEKVDRRRLRIGDQLQLGSLQGPRLRFGSEGEDLKEATAWPDSRSGQQGTEFERLRWFLDAARTLNEFGAIDEILVSLVQITLQLTKVERGFVFLTEEDGSLRLAAGRTRDGAIQQDESTISRSAIKQAIKGASKFIITDTHAAEAADRSESMVVHSIRSVICIPLRRRSSEASLAPEMMGVLYLDSQLHAGKLSLVEHDLLEVIAKEAAALLENAYLVKSEVAARKYRTELAIASQIQQGLMKVEVPKLHYAEVAARSIPCLEIGGDFYDVIESHGQLYVVIADISGKGISAALLASALQGLLYAQVKSGLPLPEIGAVANQFIFDKSVGKYATMVLVRMAEDGLVEYMNCGHVKPLVVTEDSVVQLKESNLVVGLLPNITYESTTYQLKEGERLLLVTDGVTEAENEAGDFYGDDALEAIATRSSVEQILDEIRTFIGAAPSTDDCTLVELRYRRVAAV
jgi:sigma-B regulation protein RsbU (phosphoserine phosphatase)